MIQDVIEPWAARAGQREKYRAVRSLRVELLYSAERWVRLKLRLQTPGPAAICTQVAFLRVEARPVGRAFTPVLSGDGVLLQTDEVHELCLAKGTRLYITSRTASRVNITVEPLL